MQFKNNLLIKLIGTFFISYLTFINYTKIKATFKFLITLSFTNITLTRENKNLF